MGLRGVGGARTETAELEAGVGEVGEIGEIAELDRGIALEHYQTYLPATKHDAQITRYADGFHVRGDDQRGRAFELDSRNDGRDLTLRQGGHSHRFVLHGPTVHIERDGHDVGGLERHKLRGDHLQALDLARAIHQQADARRVSPEAADAARAAERVVAARATDVQYKVTRIAIEAHFAPMDRAADALANFMNHKFEGMQHLEEFYHYTHRHYDDLLPRLAVSTRAPYSAHDPVPEVILARNSIRAEFTRTRGAVEREANRLVDHLSTQAFKRRPPMEQAEILERTAHGILGTATGGRISELLQHAHAGHGPLAALMKQAHGAHAREGVGLGADVVARLGDLPSAINDFVESRNQQQGVHRPLSANAVLRARIGSTISAAASALKISIVLAEIARTGGHAADWTALGQAVGAATASVASLVGRKAIDCRGTVASGIFGAVTAVLDLKKEGLNGNLSTAIGNGINLVGSVLLAIPHPATKLLGVVVDGLGSLIKFTTHMISPHEPAIEAAMRKARFLGEK